MSIYAKMRISNPSPYFETPDKVLGDDQLSRGDKEKVLRSMALNADQMVEATAEGMADGNPANNAKDIQSALAQLDKIQAPKIVESSSLQNARFQRIVVVTTANQNLNREIAAVAIDMAEIAGGKVYLLNVVPSAYEQVSLAAARPMVTALPLVATDHSQIMEDRTEQLAELALESGTNVETHFEVRSGQIEQVIVDYADDCGADVIVVGAPNRSWLETLFDSSIERRITSSSPCPVLIVPEAA